MTIPVTPLQGNGLPVSWYFDPRILDRERERLFATGPNYVGHQAMTPLARDWHVSEATEGAWLLINDGTTTQLMSNVCAHRAGQMFHGCGQQKSFVCPLHQWTYDFDGRLTHAPGISPTPDVRLPTRSLENWRGFLFAGPRRVADDLNEIGNWPDIGQGDWVLDRVDRDERPVNWKVVIEVFLDNYHVKPYHPSFRSFVDTSTLERGEMTRLGATYSLQSARCAYDLQRHGSPAFQAWQDAILKITGGTVPATSATWLYYYPNLIIEYYPFTLVVTSVLAHEVDRTVAVSEFYHDRRAIERVPDWPQIEKAMTDEVSLEDDEIMRSLQNGRRLLHEQITGGANLASHAAQAARQYYQVPMEDGLARLHNYLLSTLD